MFCATSRAIRPSIFGLARIFLFSCVCQAATFAVVAAEVPAGIRVQGPGSTPEIGFACCDKSVEEMQSLFAGRNVIASLNELHAEVAVAVLDFAPERAAVVRRLNQAGIRVIAWILLPKEEGYYLNADNSSAARVRIAAFEKWTAEKWPEMGRRRAGHRTKLC